MQQVGKMVCQLRERTGTEMAKKFKTRKEELEAAERVVKSPEYQKICKKIDDEMAGEGWVKMSSLDPSKSETGEAIYIVPDQMTDEEKRERAKALDKESQAEEKDRVRKEKGSFKVEKK